MAQRKQPRKRYHNYPFGVALAACIGVVIGSSIELYLMMTRA